MTAALSVHALIVRVFSQTGSAPVERCFRHFSILSDSWEWQPAILEFGRLLTDKRSQELIAITRTDGNTLAALGAPARQHRRAALGLHAAAEAVRLRTAAAIRLKCALRHGILTPEFFSDWAGPRTS